MNIKNKGFSKLILFQIFDSLAELAQVNEFTFGITKFIKYLKGTLSRRFIELNVHLNQNFGLLELIESKHIEYLINIAIIEGYIEQTPFGYDTELTVLTLTEKGIDVFLGEIEDIDYDDSLCYEDNITLFMNLVELRDEIVNKYNITPIKVCSNKVLQLISNQRPNSTELLREVPGVGNYFVDNFSDEFIARIQEFNSCVNHNTM